MGYPGTHWVTWHQPPQRGILPLDGAHFSHSLTRTLKQHRYRVSFDEAFEEVMLACARSPEECWITDEFRTVYGALQKQGHAHSLEIWVDGTTARLTGATFSPRSFCKSAACCPTKAD